MKRWEERVSDVRESCTCYGNKLRLYLHERRRESEADRIDFVDQGEQRQPEPTSSGAWRGWAMFIYRAGGGAQSVALSLSRAGGRWAWAWAFTGVGCSLARCSSSSAEHRDRTPAGACPSNLVPQSFENGAWGLPTPQARASFLAQPWHPDAASNSHSMQHVASGSAPGCWPRQVCEPEKTQKTASYRSRPGQHGLSAR